MNFSENLSLTADNLSCIRGERELFHSLEFGLKSGEVLQVTGHNGSGKTSLLRIVAGLVQPENGRVSWLGESIAESASYFGNLHYVGHQSGVKADLTALENLEFARKLKSSNYRDLFKVLAKLELRGFEDIPCGNLSVGQKRRVALARLFVSDSPLWILDEPFTALDANGVGKLEAEFLRHLEKRGIIILTTHRPLKTLNDRLQTVNPADYCRESR